MRHTPSAYGRAHLPMRAVAASLIICACLPRCARAEPAAAARPASTLPLGDPDFYPSDDRPIGWRGDGTGAWPGAKTVREWNAATGKNIVWRTPMPGPSFAQPVVAGDKVFTPADPNRLICISAIDGKILWERAVDHTTAMAPDVAAGAREAVTFWDALFRQYAIWLDLERGFTPDLPKDEIDGALKAAAEHGFEVNRPGQANFSMIGGGDPLWKRLWADQSRYSLYYFGHWEGILTHTFPTPVTDGAHVYVNMSNDQVACYDLDGDRRWLVWDRPAKAKPAEHHVRYSMSPLLVGGKLIVAACGELRAYDKATGRKLWGVSHATDFGARWVKVSPPVHMRLSSGGEPLDVLVSPGSGVYRLEDGKLIGTLPELPGYEGSTALTDGDLYVRKDAPDSGPSTRLAGRFDVAGRDRVEFAPAWETSTRGGANNLTDVLFGGRIFSPASGAVVELATGKLTELARYKSVRYSAPVLAGRTLVSIGGGGYGEREKRPGVMNAWAADVGDPSEPTAIEQAFVDRRYLEDQEFRLRWRWRGNADAVSNSSPAVQGNRLFFRTAGYLWCVGDPAEAWHTPDSAPAAARVRR